MYTIKTRGWLENTWEELCPQETPQEVVAFLRGHALLVSQSTNYVIRPAMKGDPFKNGFSGVQGHLVHFSGSTHISSEYLRSFTR